MGCGWSRGTVSCCCTSRPIATRPCSRTGSSCASTVHPTRTSRSGSARTTASVPTWPAWGSRSSSRSCCGASPICGWSIRRSGPPGPSRRSCWGSRRCRPCSRRSLPPEQARARPHGSPRLVEGQDVRRRTDQPLHAYHDRAGPADRQPAAPLAHLDSCLHQSVDAPGVDERDPFEIENDHRGSQGGDPADGGPQLRHGEDVQLAGDTDRDLVARPMDTDGQRLDGLHPGPPVTPTRSPGPTCTGRLGSAGRAETRRARREVTMASVTTSRAIDATDQARRALSRPTYFRPDARTTQKITGRNQLSVDRDDRNDPSSTAGTLPIRMAPVSGNCTWPNV